MDNAFSAVHPDVRLRSEIILLVLPCLMHRRVALPAPVLGRTRRCDDAGVRNGAPVGANALAVQIQIYGVQDRPA